MRKLCAWTLALAAAAASPEARPGSGRYFSVCYNANYYYGSPYRAATSTQFVGTLTRHLDLMQALGIPAEYYFTGLAAENLGGWSPATVARILSSGHGVHYHGHNRPPSPQVWQQVYGQSWTADTNTVYTYDVLGTNPGSGAHVGGLTAVRSVFGVTPLCTGRFLEASILSVDRAQGVRMGVGLSENTGAPSSVAWLLGCLNRPEVFNIAPSEWTAYPPVWESNVLAGLRKRLDILPANRFNLVTLLVHDSDFYGVPASRADNNWATYEAIIRLAQGLGFRIVPLSTILGLARNGPRPTFARATLRSAADGIVSAVAATGSIPDYAAAAGTPSTLAEVFEALASALSTYRATGSLPKSVATRDLLGPTSGTAPSLPSGTFPANDVLAAAASVFSAMTDRLPTSAAAGTRTINTSELLHAFAQEFAALDNGAPASTSHTPLSIVPPSARTNNQADALTRLQFWTLKPAVMAAK